MMTKFFAGFLLTAYVAVIIWGIILSGRRRRDNWFKILRWNILDLGESLRKVRPK